MFIISPNNQIENGDIDLVVKSTVSRCVLSSLYYPLLSRPVPGILY